MNKYETRAEAVINKKQAYMAKRKKRIRGITTAVASVTCAAVACAAVFVFRSSLDSANNNPTLIPVSTQAQEKPSGYDGKKIYIFDEEENYGDFKTCYINENNEENPYSELNRFGVLGVSGELAVPPIYDRALAAGENCFIVEKEGTNGTESALVDSDGNILFGYFRGNILPVFYDKEVHVLIVDTVENNDFLIDTSGKNIIDIDFEDLSYAHTTGWEGYNSDELIKGIGNGKYYLIDYKGEIVHVFGDVPTVKESLGEGFNLTAVYKSYQGNYKTLLFGVSNENGEEIIPCEYPTLYFTGDRFVCRQGEEQGLNPDDIVVIYDTQGNVVCESGIFNLVSIDYGAQTGIGVVFPEWDYENSFSIGGHWVIDNNGKKLSDEYDRIEKNPDGTYTAYYDRQSKSHLLDSNGIIIE